ncbi:MAG: four helix bundle protein, partial [Pyrinomonadaceae bacterium]
MTHYELLKNKQAHFYSHERNLLLDKSFAFSVRVVNAYKHLVKARKEFVLSKQFLRSGTSVG